MTGAITGPAAGPVSPVERRALLRRRLSGLGRDRAGPVGPGRVAVRLPEPDPTPPPVRAPLSAAQRRAWRYQQRHPQGCAYNACLRLDLTGQVDTTTLLAAFDLVVARHEVLRTSYLAGRRGEASQLVHPGLRPRVRVLDPLPADRFADVLGAVAEGAAVEPFDLARDAPLRIVLVPDRAGGLVVLLTVHRVAWDDRSTGVLLTDLGRAYRRLLGTAPAPAPLPVQYADFAAYQRLRAGLPDPRRAARREYWREVLSPPPAPLLGPPAEDPAQADQAQADQAQADQAPADQAQADQAQADQAPADQAPADQAPADQAPADQAPAARAPADPAPTGPVPKAPVPAEQLRRLLPAAAAAALHRAGAGDPAALLLAGTALLLHRRTGAVDLALGTILSGPGSSVAGISGAGDVGVDPEPARVAGPADLIGNFDDPVVVRLDLSADPVVADLLAAADAALAGAVRNRDLPHEQVARDACAGRAGGVPAELFDVAVSLRTGRLDGTGPAVPDLPGVAVRCATLRHGDGPRPLTVHAELDGDRLRVDVEHRPEVFDRAAVDELVAGLGAVLPALLADPAARCSELLSRIG